MFKLLIEEIKKNTPIITVLLFVSSCISTIPQFVLPDIYSRITGTKASLDSFFIYTLSSFTHSPEMLVKHFVVNMMVLLLFGSLTEILIGTKKFALLSILTFLATSLTNYFHDDSIYAGHGASGIIWAYHVFFVFVVIIIVEKIGKKAFKDSYIFIGTLISIFTLILLPFLEVFIFDKYFFQNFGQTLHLISLCVAVPFVLIERKSIEDKVGKLIQRKNIERKISIKNIPVVIIIMILGMNLYGTVRVAGISVNLNDLKYEMVPDLGTLSENVGDKVVISFDEKIKKAELTNWSISYDDKYGEPKVSEELLNENQLVISFDRELVKDDDIYLEYNITRFFDGIEIPEKFVLEYK